MYSMFVAAFVISAVILVAVIASAVILYKKECAIAGKLLLEKHSAFSPFQIFLMGFFAASAVIFFPVYYCEYFAGEEAFAKLIKSLLLSVRSAMQLFTIEADFALIGDVVSDQEKINAAFGIVYSVYSAFIYVIAPILTAGFVLSFFKNASATFRYMIHPKSDIYLMSALNERSIALAQDILTNPKIKGKKLVVFTDVFEKDDERLFELITKAKRLGAICFRKDITEIGLKFYKKNDVRRKIYFIGDEDHESENMNQALEMINRFSNEFIMLKGKKIRNKHYDRYNNENTELYVYAQSSESEVLLNSVKENKMKIRRIKESRNLAISTLRKHSIFEDANKNNKKINIVIVGLGGYGKELFKAICWSGQMIGYELCIHIFDSSESIESKIRCIAPGLIDLNDCKEDGCPRYSISFHNNIDVTDYSFLEEISAIENVTTAYVTLGDDELNIETAMKMRTQFGRNNVTRGTIIPPIYAVVYSSLKNRTICNNGGFRSINDEQLSYGIEIIGSLESRYKIEEIEMLELEEAGMKCHLSWVEADLQKYKNDPEKRRELEKKRLDNISSYNRYEYNRRSSISQAIHTEFAAQLQLDKLRHTAEGDKYEHMRWSAFMLAEGYVGYGADKKPDSIKNDISKMHPRLASFFDLDGTSKKINSSISSK